MSQSAVCLDTELRKLRPAELYTLGQILNIYDSWKKLMAIIPKKENCELPKFNTEHFSMIEHAARQQRRNAAEIFLAEWGTMGKQRPTLRVLLELLVKAELFRAADYVAGDILKEELPKRPECGPAAPVDISDEEIQKLLEEKLGSQDIDFNESLIFGLPSDTNDNKMINPNAIDNVVNDNTLERNMQSTKLVSMKEKHHKKCLENVGNQQQENIEISDLMKFSNEHNIEECRVYNDSNGSKQPVNNTFNTNSCNSQECVFNKHELPSSDLPVFLNEFGQNVKQTKLNGEVTSDELPAFLNSSMSTSDSNTQINSINDSLNFSNLNLNQNEVVSAELPQCIVELAINPDIISNEENLIQNTLDSQELPITVLEYND
nr:uncharacterized protein LOC116426821 [Nomia melanderi]